MMLIRKFQAGAEEVKGEEILHSGQLPAAFKLTEA